MVGARLRGSLLDGFQPPGTTDREPAGDLLTAMRWVSFARAMANVRATTPEAAAAQWSTLSNVMNFAANHANLAGISDLWGKIYRNEVTEFPRYWLPGAAVDDRTDFAWYNGYAGYKNDSGGFCHESIDVGERVCLERGLEVDSTKTTKTCLELTPAP